MTYSKQLQLILRKAMVLYIIPYHIIGDLLSYGSIETRLLPEVTSPKLLFHLRKLLEDLAARNTLQNSNYPCNGIPRWEGNQYVHMILGNLTSVYLKIKMVAISRKSSLTLCCIFAPRASFLYSRHHTRRYLTSYTAWFVLFGLMQVFY
jgi:hypothetical protein